MTSSRIKDFEFSLTGRHHGIIKHIQMREPGFGDWPFYYGYAEICDVGVLNNTMSFRPPAAGIGDSYEKAFYSIVGEGVERYCASFKQQDKLLDGCQTTLSMHHAMISPKQLSCFSDEQHLQENIPYHNFTCNDVIEWQQAYRLFSDSNQEILVPAAYVYIPYLGAGQNLIAANSTGLACGQDLASALESAIYEVLERDAYSLCWLYGGHPPHLNIENSPELLDEIPCYGHQDWTIEFFDLTGREAIPIILCVLRAPKSYRETHSEDRWYCHGVAAHLDPKLALLKAYREAMLGYFFLEVKCQKMMLDEQESNKDNKFNKTVSDPIDFEQHALFYNKHPEKIARLDFLDQGELTDWGDSIGTRPNTKTGLVHLSERLLSHGVNGAYVDLTTEDVQQMDLTVVRVLLEGFTWLHGDNRLPYLGTPRASQAEKYYDYLSGTTDGLLCRSNPWPHSLG